MWMDSLQYEAFSTMTAIHTQHNIIFATGNETDCGETHRELVRSFFTTGNGTDCGQTRLLGV
jgi:hypothetical protein